MHSQVTYNIKNRRLTEIAFDALSCEQARLSEVYMLSSPEPANIVSQERIKPLRIIIKALCAEWFAAHLHSNDHKGGENHAQLEIGGIHRLSKLIPITLELAKNLEIWDSESR